jgi:hypothetical protein
MCLFFLRECREEVQVIFFVDGVIKSGASVNHGTLQALLNFFDFYKQETGERFGKEDLQALVADICTLDDKMNTTAECIPSQL